MEVDEFKDNPFTVVIDQDDHIHVVRATQSYDLSHHAHAFLRSADILPNIIEAEEYDKKSEYLFPMLFCYRHSCELILKELLFYTERAIDESKIASDQKFGLEKMMDFIFARSGHRIGALLDKLLERSTFLGLDPIPQEVIYAVKRLGDEDPNGEVFRYPFSRQVELHYENAMMFDVRNIKNVLGHRLHWLLEARLQQIKNLR